jgi:uncharacterized protein YehS (DUF1456 family)
MINNDVLRRLRYIFDLSDQRMMSIFADAGWEASRAEISDWLKKDNDPAFQECADIELAAFLNGLINDKRGKREGPQAKPEKRLSNNLIIMKLKIALNMKADDVLEIMRLANFSLSKHELSAFFRKPDHKHYRKCQDQVLRYFLQGLQLHHRQTALDEEPWPFRD